jgi:hypothetical protein
MIMANFWKTKSFSELAKEWANKLADSGFFDAEEEIKGQYYLKQTSMACFKGQNGTTLFIESKEKYYKLVSDAANWDYEMSPRDKIIMLNYSIGTKQSDIIKELEKEGMKCHRIVITRTISKYLVKWKIPTLKVRKTK